MFLPLLKPPYSLGHNINLRPINHPTNSSKYSSEWRHTSLTFNPMLELIKPVRKRCQKPRQPEMRPPASVSQVVDAKGKFLKEIMKTTPVEHTNGKWNSLIADMEKVSVVWIEDKINHSIPLSQNLVQNKALRSSIL